MPRLLPITLLSLTFAYLLPRHYPALLSPSPAITFLTVFLPLLLTSALYHVLLYPRFLSPLRYLPGPKPSTLLLGEFPLIYRLPTGFPHITWQKLPNDGLIRYLGLWNTERLFPTSIEMLKEILHTQADVFVKPNTLGGLSTILGKRGLFFAEGEEQKHYRRMLLPSFGVTHLRKLVPVFWDKAMEMVDCIIREAQIPTEDETVTDEEREKGRLVDISKWASLATLDIIGTAGFGYDFNALKNGEEANELSNAYAKLLKRDRAAMGWIMLMMLLPWWLAYWLPTESARTIRKSQKTFQRVSTQLIRERREKQLSNPQSKDSDIKDNDILSVMLRSGEFDTPSGEEIARDQIMTFLAAGHETTATALSWALHALTLHPAHQSLLRTELYTLFPRGPPKALTHADLTQLPKLRNFCLEVLRLYPPVPLTLRTAKRETILNGGVRVPKGTMVVVVPWALHRSTGLWGDDAGEFRPGRWEGYGQPGKECTINSWMLQTFISGPRSCIGEKFSLWEFMVLVTGVVGRVEVRERVEGVGRRLEEMGSIVEIQGGITGKPKDGRVWVKEVEWGSSRGEKEE
ncbi:cytochrome P450 [Ascodesmis nigricans]|uniref:Cytochrome P450 n=1 Tax=Ascodesmis nigricans TaxID=341454 RepID=A0A4S2MQS7_9PEZI|nr:cytochrome P450 [Ascodesmis nigricans]